MLSRARQGPSPRWPLIGQQHLFILTLSCEVALSLSPPDRGETQGSENVLKDLPGPCRPTPLAVPRGCPE